MSPATCWHHKINMQYNGTSNALPSCQVICVSWCLSAAAPPRQAAAACVALHALTHQQMVSLDQPVFASTKVCLHLDYLFSKCLLQHVQAAGTAEGDKDAAEASAQSMPDQAQGPQQAQQGMQEGPQAPPQGQQSSFGMADAGAGGAPMPSLGHDKGQQQSDSAEQKESNPYRWAFKGSLCVLVSHLSVVYGCQSCLAEPTFPMLSHMCYAN